MFAAMEMSLGQWYFMIDITFVLFLNPVMDIWRRFGECCKSNSILVDNGNLFWMSSSDSSLVVHEKFKSLSSSERIKFCVLYVILRSRWQIDSICINENRWSNKQVKSTLSSFRVCEILDNPSYIESSKPLILHPAIKVYIFMLHH